ncbi:MAG: tRNA pseudouridine(38-40) synthase TruA [Anaerolineales bacterium]
MARYQAVLAYDGTLFNGFQRQAEGRTVQGEVETALRRIGWKGSSILAAGRTDSGVHALGQVIAFDLDWTHPPDALLRAINANLPADVAVRKVKPTLGGFHPRFDAVARRYRYRIFFQPVRDPLRERYVWRVWPPMDLDRLHRAASQLIGEYDFRAFGTPPRPGGGTVRTIYEAVWVQDRDTFVFEIEANAFLYRMVRRIVQLQVEIGQRKPVERVTQFLTGELPGMVQGLAPPHGLALIMVRYPNSCRSG